MDLCCSRAELDTLRSPRIWILSHFMSSLVLPAAWKSVSYHLTTWENKMTTKITNIIISSASLPTFRHHCNSASDVNIWAWFSFNGFNNKIQSNVNFVLFLLTVKRTYVNIKAFKGDEVERLILKCTEVRLLLCPHWAWTMAPPWPYPNPLGPKFLA